MSTGLLVLVIVTRYVTGPPGSFWDAGIGVMSIWTMGTSGGTGAVRPTVALSWPVA
jgi:hypothetical protein